VLGYLLVMARYDGAQLKVASTLATGCPVRFAISCLKNKTSAASARGSAARSRPSDPRDEGRATALSGQL